jgi:hypothetical protein
MAAYQLCLACGADKVAGVCVLCDEYVQMYVLPPIDVCGRPMPHIPPVESSALLRCRGCGGKVGRLDEFGFHFRTRCQRMRLEMHFEQVHRCRRCHKARKSIAGGSGGYGHLIRGGFHPYDCVGRDRCVRGNGLQGARCGCDRCCPPRKGVGIVPPSLAGMAPSALLALYPACPPLIELPPLVLPPLGALPPLEALPPSLEDGGCDDENGRTSRSRAAAAPTAESIS